MLLCRIRVSQTFKNIDITPFQVNRVIPVGLVDKPFPPRWLLKVIVCYKNEREQMKNYLIAVT